MVVAGRRPALEAVRSGIAQELIVSAAGRATHGLRELLDAAAEAGLPVRRAEDAELERLAAGVRHQGAVALIRAPRRLTLAELGGRPWDEDAVVLVLDGVEDPHNLGACARTAEAAGAAALVIRQQRGAPIGAAAVRASAGALLHIPVGVVPNIAAAIRRLRAARFWVVGLDGDGTSVAGVASPPPGRLALVAGAEGEGLSRLVRERCDELLSIPMRGRVASLNVSAAVAVGLYAYARPSGSSGFQPEKKESRGSDV